MMTPKTGDRRSPPSSPVPLLLALCVLLSLLCLARAVAGDAVGREEAARSDEERRQLGEHDLDNSIGALADVAPGKQRAAGGGVELEQQASKRRRLGEEDKERTRNEGEWR